MTYNEAVNTILEYYMLGDFPGWTMTDPDSAQMRRITKDGRYEFVELLKTTDPDSNTVVFYHEFIDLEEYSEGDLWFYGSAYYENEEGLEAQGADIAAECMFEQTSTADAWGSPYDMLELYLRNVREE